MEKESLKILAKAISDVGCWCWWVTDINLVQLEFRGVQLLNNNSLDKNSKSAHIALRFSENDFLIFFDKNEENDWHIKLQKDEIEPFPIHYDFFEFNNNEMINEIERAYTNKIVIKENKKMDGIKNVLVFKAGSVAVVIGGDIFGVYDRDGEITEKNLLERNKLWWIFWKDYWEERETNEAYNKDYACEVTIPVKEK